MGPSHDTASLEVAQAKPLRRRRRWLTVAFVLVLVSCAAWWYWPGGDARFVGKWRLREEYSLDFGRDFHLRSNGTCEAEFGAFFVLGEWNVTDEHLELGKRAARGREAVPIWIYLSQALHPEQRNMLIDDSFVRYEIRSVANELIRLEIKDDLDVVRHYELKRLSE